MAMWRELRAGQVSRVMIGHADGGEPVGVFRTDAMVVEAPNWTPDGRWLVVNAEGRLWRLAAEGSSGLEPIELPGLPPVNNDHVLAPDGEHVFASAADGHIYLAPLAGGTSRRVTNDVEPATFMHFLHGVSPDGRTLAYVGVARTADGTTTADLYLIPSEGGPDRRLTDRGPSDGCEYFPDGKWIYFNTEAFSDTAGHAQIARMRADGTGVEQLTFDERVNWFPHWSPDGATALYLSYSPGTVSHPADLPIELRLVVDHDWAHARTVVETFGGQGTVNVNSWAPDSRRLGYVDYPVG